MSSAYLDAARQYDVYGRLEQATNQTNNAYTRFVYDADGNYVHTYQTVIDLNPAHEFHSWQILDGAGRVRLTASDHPGSTGGYQGQYVIYDNMGRVTEQSNPTELDRAWVPSGDDAGGWRGTQQTYDWKGRPKQTTNSDGTTRVVSYGGCGCAGGEVTTVQDEHGRQRRFTKDALSRLGTVEELNWPWVGGVYATTSYAYDARDQITEINQAGQIRSFIYDGHGRLLTRSTPEQGTTSYSYYDDDTTHVVTDARQTTTTYVYNNRHQITSLTYNVSGDPTGQTTATSNVSFGYDAAGNRTSMSDGLGAVSYVYNNLAQMSSETRTFNGLSSYTLSYGYNLAGELSSVTNPWGAQVGYDYDKAGRLQSVSGSGYAGVSNYASALSYRAFGAIKGMSYGNGRSLSTGYDNRLRATTWNVSGVLGYNYTYNYTYMHESTGRVTYAQNIYDATLDRSYEYDHLGRLAISHSGTEARAHVFDGNLWGTMDGPYSQGYDYDVWGNVTKKYGWGGEVHGDGPQNDSSINYYYTNNRRVSFGYDAAGNVTNDGMQSFSYDATGQQIYASGIGAGGSAPTFTAPDPLVAHETEIKLIHLTELRDAVNQLRVRAGLAVVTTWNPDPDSSLQQNVTTVKAAQIRQLRTKLEEALNALHLPVGGYAHSGPNQGDPIYAIDFQELRTKIKDAWTALASTSALNQSYDGDGLRVKKTEYAWTTWYLRSSVLGGQVIAEVDGNNVWQRGYVYAGGSLMAVQQSGVFWMHEDPITKSKRTTDANGNVVSAIELDPWGADTSRSSSGAFQPRKYTSYDRDGNGTDEAMFRRYSRKNSRFDQPDPYEGSYSLSDPQNFNRYAYTQNDPVNLVDPTGLLPNDCVFDDQGRCVIYSGYTPAENSLRAWARYANSRSLIHTAGTGGEPHGKGGAGGGTGGKVAQNPNKVGPHILNDPDTLSANGKNCSLTVTFTAGTSYPGYAELKNGVSTIPYNGISSLGLGFTVSGFAKGGIGRVGGTSNPQNPGGSWTMDQSTSRYLALNGQTLSDDHERSRRDISIGINFSAGGDSFSWYDHPGGPPNDGLLRMQNFTVSVSNGNERCAASFHFLQTGNGIHWGQGSFP
jgi:RHS repeat-associated protein